jgi:CheY-like chemotaxis protein
MPPARDLIDLESLLREAISSLAVTAYARGIGITAHVDNRLPSRVQCDVKALSSFLRRGMARTIGAERTRKIAFALWRGAEEDGEAPILLEACRAVEAGAPPLTGLAGLWALPLDGATAQPAAQPAAAGQLGTIESVLIPLPCTAAKDAAPIARKWRESFRGRHILVVRDVLLDRGRSVASFAALGLRMSFTESATQAMEVAQAGAEAGQPPDFLVLDRDFLGDGATALARRFRADPALAGTRILLSVDRLRTDPPSDEEGLFDLVQRSPMPWPRLIDVLHDLTRTSGETAGKSTDKSTGETPAGYPTRSREAGAIPALAGRRILIAEDVATNQVLLEALLAPTGAKVESVIDGAAVLKRHAQAPADLILMDLQMPGMGGIAAMRRLRQIGGAAGSVPVVALTAYARCADRQMALDAGMDAYLAKPVMVTEFYDLLRRLLPADGATGNGATGEGAAG